MSKIYRNFYDEVLEDTKRHDAIDEAIKMGWDCYAELVDNYRSCHLKYKGFDTNNANMEVDILMTDYDLDAYRLGL